MGYRRSDLRDARAALRTHQNPEKAAFFPRFFKCGPGEYGEGDRFLGVTVPKVRAVGKNFRDLSLQELQKLLNSPWHEERLLALVILVERHRRAESAERQKIYRFYLKHIDRVNNWDLVDVSAPQIVGETLLESGDRRVLERLVRSKSLWRRRVALLATFAFIRRQDFKDALRILRILVPDDHDLIHKASGWMLREIGKRDPQVLLSFLKRHYRNLPRTTLRYAIEKFPKNERDQLLAGKFNR